MSSATARVVPVNGAVHPWEIVRSADDFVAYQARSAMEGKPRVRAAFNYQGKQFVGEDYADAVRQVQQEVPVSMRNIVEIYATNTL
jgi:hypothetical protein